MKVINWMRTKKRFLILLTTLLLIGAAAITVLLFQGGHRHQYSEWEVKKEAGCATAGEEVRVCSCGAEEKREIEPLGHTEVKNDDVAATCTQNGYKGGSHCAVCGKTIQEAQVIPAAHTEETVPGIAATCTRAGKEEGKICSVCGEVVLKQKKIQSKGHQYHNGVCVNCKALQPDSAAAIMIDQLNEEAQANFITKEAYSGGKISFNVYVPEGASWWAVSWTQNPEEIGLYEWAAKSGQQMHAAAGQWTHCTVNIPSNGKYYIYVVGAKGEWKGKALLIDDVEIFNSEGTLIASDNFDDGVDQGIFNIVAKNPSSERVAVYTKKVCDDHNIAEDAAFEATCVKNGMTQGYHCTLCGKVLKAQNIIWAAGHEWENRKCKVCGADQANLAAAINVDLMSENAPMSFITKKAYPGGSTVTFKAYVPEGAGWWAVNWTTDPSDADLYKWATENMGVQMQSMEGWWAEYSVTLPDDGRQYYIYLSGAKGEWNGRELQVDEFRVSDKTGKELLNENFDGGTRTWQFNTASNAEIVHEKEIADTCKYGHSFLVTGYKAATCTETGLTAKKVCIKCRTIFEMPTEIPAKGHQWKDGVCDVCGIEEQDMAAAIRVDQLNDSAPMNFITKKAYPAGSKLCFKVKIPKNVNGWAAVSWTTDPKNADIYQWSQGNGQVISASQDEWTDLEVTLPSDGKEYYIYFVGEKGQWKDQYLLINDVVIKDQDGNTLAEDNFNNGVLAGIFEVIAANPTTGEKVVFDYPVEDPCKKGHTAVIDPAVEPTCTEPGKTEGSHCQICQEIITAQNEIPAKGHVWEDGKCSVCHTERQDFAAAIYIDQLNENAPMNLITRKAYPGGSTVTFKAYVPEGASWWTVSWTTDTNKTGLYKWAEEGLGTPMTSVEGKWSEYRVTLPEDEEEYYIYFTGEKGNWSDKILQIDDVVIQDREGTIIAQDDFDSGVKGGIFSAVTENPTTGKTVVFAKTVEDQKETPSEKPSEDQCKDGHVYLNGKCLNCQAEEENAAAENKAAAINIDTLNESAPMSFITKKAYPGGSNVSFKAYVPENTSWWAVCWTTDPNNTDLYKWTEGAGQSMASKAGEWTEYSVTLPEDGNEYYVYIVGAKGEWKGEKLLVDDFVVKQGETYFAGEDFNKGVENSEVISIAGNDVVTSVTASEAPSEKPGETPSEKPSEDQCKDGHVYLNGKCLNCQAEEENAAAENKAAAINIDTLNESAPMSFITKKAYPGGSNVSFKAYVPENTSWWAVCWTTDPNNTDLYKWTEGAGQSMASKAGEWAEYSVTLPEDGNEYYVYIVGAKGEWKGGKLLVDDFVVKQGETYLAGEDFNKGVENSEVISIAGNDVVTSVSATENKAAAISIDTLNESAPMSFITKKAYPGGSNVSFKAYVPEGASWWAVSWTTDPSNTDLYKWTNPSLGSSMASKAGEWTEYSVTLPEDGNEYYIYIVGAKGEWKGEKLLVDDFVVKQGESCLAEEDFNKGLEESIFNTAGNDVVTLVKGQE